jgi:hypothetical protein
VVVFWLWSLFNAMPTIPQKIYDLIEYGFKTDGWPEYNEWAARVAIILRDRVPERGCSVCQHSSRI